MSEKRISLGPSVAQQNAAMARIRKRSTRSDAMEDEKLKAIRERHEHTVAEIQNNFGAAYSSRITDSYQIHLDRKYLLDRLTARPATAGSEGEVAEIERGLEVEAVRLRSDGLLLREQKVMRALNLIRKLRAPTPAAVVTREQMKKALVDGMADYKIIGSDRILDIILPLISGATVAVDEDAVAAWLCGRYSQNLDAGEFEARDHTGKRPWRQDAKDLIASGLLSATPEPEQK